MLESDLSAKELVWTEGRSIVQPIKSALADGQSYIVASEHYKKLKKGTEDRSIYAV
jgi:hypothetical protein